MRRFRKKPVEVDAEHVDLDKLHRLSPEFRAAVCTDKCVGTPMWDGRPGPHVHTLEGSMRISDGDWLIKGVAGEFYPCKPEIFDMTYEPA